MAKQAQARKPLPQFGSWEESVAFYKKYGQLKYWGRLYRGCRYYTLDTIDGRHLELKVFDDGKVEELLS